MVSPQILPTAGDTIAACATVVARSAVAVIRVSGPGAHAIVKQLVRKWQPVVGRASLTTLFDPTSNSVLDQAVMTVREAPHTFTGEDMVELAVHGGYVAPVLVLNALFSAGARAALPGEFTRRAVLNGRLDLLQAEAIGDLIDARSRAMHLAAMHQLDGGLSRRIAILRTAILEVESVIAYDVDFPEEDNGPVAEEQIQIAVTKALEQLDQLLHTTRVGELVREGAAIVIAGPPNAGKSSLFNALVGASRAIVTDLPGTTRDALEASIEIGRWPVRLVDTAGLRESQEVVERLGVEVSEEWLARADLVLACSADTSYLPELRQHIEGFTAAPIIGIQTKSDLIPDAPGQWERVRSSESAIPLSVWTGEGMEELATRIAAVLEESHGQLQAPVDGAPLLTRERHRRAIEKARDELKQFKRLWQEHEVPAVVVAVHLQAATHALEDLIGAVSADDVLDRVFANFCVGK